MPDVAPNDTSMTPPMAPEICIVISQQHSRFTKRTYAASQTYMRVYSQPIPKFVYFHCRVCQETHCTITKIKCIWKVVSEIFKKYKQCVVIWNRHRGRHFGRSWGRSWGQNRAICHHAATFVAFIGFPDDELHFQINSFNRFHVQNGKRAMAPSMAPSMAP